MRPYRVQLARWYFVHRIGFYSPSLDFVMLDELFSFLRDEDFQDPASGQLNFPAYLYAYPPEEEYAFREALPTLCERLERPPIHQVPFVLNVFDHLVERLRSTTYSDKSYLDIVLEQEAEAPEKTERLFNEVLSAGSGFYKSIHRCIRSHQDKAENKERRTYAFVHGWGTIHPYLRASQFMGGMEKHVDQYKLILFYPGSYSGGRLQFLGHVGDRGPYRAQNLNDQVGSGLSA